jgi:hypothetical protein
MENATAGEEPAAALERSCKGASQDGLEISYNSMAYRRFQ